MHGSGDLDFSFSGLKTAVATLVRRTPPDADSRADIACEFEQAVVDVLAGKAVAAMERTGSARLVVAGGVGANRVLRARLGQAADRAGFEVYFPPLEFCTDNAAMIALAGAMRLSAGTGPSAGLGFGVRPRWALHTLEPAQASAAVEAGSGSHRPPSPGRRPAA